MSDKMKGTSSEIEPLRIKRCIQLQPNCAQTHSSKYKTKL